MSGWRKLGLIFEPDCSLDWQRSHAAVPVADHLSNATYRVYYSSRNSKGESAVGYFILDLDGSPKILERSVDPVLRPGELGCFDDSGVMASCIIDVGTKKYMYYIGWNLGVTVPFRNSIGLAVSDDNGKTFSRAYQGPIVDRSRLEPHFVASCCVLREADIFKMWYLSCTGWDIHEGKPRHYYHIKSGESADGIVWERNGDVAIDYRDEHEYAISVPRVIKEDAGYHMWFSSRASQASEHYRIREAHSADGKQWNRYPGSIAFTGAREDWDDTMQCYPCVFDCAGSRYMLYNGNDYGRSGIGLAVLNK